jgi:methylmalonyl-CoA/ethylmalonyl-CoA epimerase
MLSNFTCGGKSAMPAPTMNAAITRLGQVSINAHDLERATSFYRDTIGLTFLFTTGNMSFFDCGGVRLMVTPPERPEFDHPGSVLYFSVGDIQGFHSQMEGKGVRFEAKPHLIARLPTHDLWMAFFYDSENNLMALMSEVARG